MKILIIGVHGFVVSNLVTELKGEHEIYGLDIVAPENDGPYELPTSEDVWSFE